MKKIIFISLFLLMKATFCQSDSDVLQTKLNKMHSLTANFKQVVKDKKREISNSTGIMALQRPGLFRWHTKEPMEQILVADSKKLWIYDVELEQVTVKKQDKSLGGTAALFLSGYNNKVTDDFDVRAKRDGQKEIFDLNAKSNKANFQHLKLVFQNDVLTSLEMDDQLGQHTIVDLSQIKLNPNVAKSLFQFKPPKGTDVVEQ
ncbi:MAG: outer membrane lipoprotein chaperone LolA [Proteobacteria bacterium]|nr:outer membrane lipoprotein chaperone LolA [Pseudomonadota bacterium]